jgi:16S rRNA (cytidine1402-2'-O)-methyltransferase
MNTAVGAGKLSLVATPIGNLEDITLRALQRLREADVIAAEDTRRTLKLLNHFQLATPLVSYYKEIERRRTAELIPRLQAGEKIALVTDAGTPGVSDPGAVLVAEARRQGIAVEVIPGPSALLTALTGSGLTADEFSFHGFLDTRSGARIRQLAGWRTRPETQVFFVAPHRLRAVLTDLQAAWGGERQAVWGRELTKIHEEFKQGTLEELGRLAAETEPRGEYTLVVQGFAGPAEGTEIREESLETHLERLQAEGLSLNQAVGRVARERGMDRHQVYALAHARKKGAGN